MKVTWSKKAKKDDSESSNLVRNPINKFSQNKKATKTLNSNLKLIFSQN